MRVMVRRALSWMPANRRWAWGSGRSADRSRMPACSAKGAETCRPRWRTRKRAQREPVTFSDGQDRRRGLGRHRLRHGTSRRTCGRLVGAGMVVLVGTAGNRIWRDFEPSVMASIERSGDCRTSLAELGIESTSRELPAGLRFMVDGMRLRSPARVRQHRCDAQDIAPTEQYDPAEEAPSDAQLRTSTRWLDCRCRTKTATLDDLGEIDPYAGPGCRKTTSGPCWRRR